jgi:hypothetical protein
MRAFFIFTLVLIPAVYAQFLPANLIPETLQYRMLSGSVEVGSSRVTITHDNIAGTIFITESISGLFEQTTIVNLRNDSTLQTLTSHTVLSRDNKYQEAQVQYQDRGTRVKGEVRRPPEFGGQREVDVELEPGTADSYAVPYLFRSTRLAVGKTIRVPVYNALQNEKGSARGWIARIEPVVVPAGNFECYRLEAFSGNSRLILNLDTQFPHRVIRLILPALEVKLELESISPGDTTINRQQR